MKRLYGMALALGCAALVFTPAAAAPPALFSMDDVLSAPFVEDLTASPDHRALVWTVHERGARNVAVWKDGVARNVTSYADDDGAELDAVQFTPDESAVVFERGGAGQDGGGENPDPTAPAKRAPRRIVLASIAGGSTLELGEGGEPAVSPKGDRVAWIAKGQVVSATLSTDDHGKTWSAGKPEPLFTVRGTASAPLWSPDGSRIAVVDHRGDHTFVAIYALGAKDLVFAAPDFANDGFPAWSPDGTSIALVRRPARAIGWSVYDDPPAQPWSIVVADARTGAGRVVWRADRGMGHEFSAPGDAAHLWWSRDGEIGFMWEKDGWRHLYAVPARGGAARLLTPGAFEVEQVTPTADRTALLYTSNQGDLDSRHVWKVAFAGGAPGRVSGGPTNQWSPAALGDGSFAFIDAGYANPPQVTLFASGSTHALSAEPTPRVFPASALVEPRVVTFHAPDGLLLHGQLLVPADGAARHPALVFVHGGPQRQILPGFNTMEAYTDLYELTQELVNRGFEVLSINYRDGIMYGHDFREPPHRGYLGASEYQDVLAGAAFLRARADVDAKRLGIYGLSYGGYLTALALARNSDIFAAGADMSGVHDWRQILDAWMEHPVGTAQQRAIAYASSPVSGIATLRSPIFLSQGDDDRNVPFAQGVDFAERLRDRGADVTDLVTPDETHEYIVYAHELALYQAVSNFLAARLHAPR
ncbi:MAG TPA: prolyl oligopeptidase family serine peptidase [Candidatus Limnocylindria bacterium]|nr:prolyl oligopeptidase family serine peptidase [Candidatus Limnocylindria bacterium]